MSVIQRIRDKAAWFIFRCDCSVFAFILYKMRFQVKEAVFCQ